MPTPVPTVEAANYRYAASVRRPHCEANTLNAIDLHGLSAEHAADFPMVALGKQVHVHFAELGTKAERVFGDLFATGPANLQQIRLLIGQSGEEKAGHLPLLHGRQDSPAAAFKHFDAQRIRQVGAHDQPITVRVRAKNGKRVAMFGAHQRVDISIGW